MASRIVLQGGGKLRRTLKKAGADLKEFRAVNKKVAGVVAARARSTAPVGPPKGGHIKNDIRTTASQRVGRVVAGGKRRPYAGAIHWGWSARNIESQPWIAVAAKQTEAKWVNMYHAEVLKIINQVKGI